jgi:hypothetical protein
MSDSPIFAGLEPHKWKVCVPRLTGRREEKAMKEAQLRSRSDGTKPNLIR